MRYCNAVLDNNLLIMQHEPFPEQWAISIGQNPHCQFINQPNMSRGLRYQLHTALLAFQNTASRNCTILYTKCGERQQEIHLKVLPQKAGPCANGSMIYHTSPNFQQQQLIKCLQSTSLKQSETISQLPKSILSLLCHALLTYEKPVKS